MKNLINKVLVVLAVSALVAGNINAKPKRETIEDIKARNAAKTAKERVQSLPLAQREKAIDQQGVNKLNILATVQRIQTNGINDINKEYSARDRAQDLSTIEGLSYVTKEEVLAVKHFLLGTEKGNTRKVRAPYQSATNKTLETVKTKEGDKQAEKVKAATVDVQENPTPENIAIVQKEISYLSKMYDYLPSAKQTSAAAAIGIAIAGVASVGYDIYQGAMPGTTALSAGKGAYSAVTGAPRAFWDGGKWVVTKGIAAGKTVGSAIIGAPAWAKGLVGSYVGSTAGRGTPTIVTSVEQPTVTSVEQPTEEISAYNPEQ